MDGSTGMQVTWSDRRIPVETLLCAYTITAPVKTLADSSLVRVDMTTMFQHYLIKAGVARRLSGDEVVLCF